MSAFFSENLNVFGIFESNAAKNYFICTKMKIVSVVDFSEKRILQKTFVNFL